MTVTELIEAIGNLQKEIGCDGKGIASHKLQSSVSFRLKIVKD